MKISVRIWENLVALTIGVLLICLNANDATLPSFVQVVGVLFIVPGLINIFSVRRDAKKKAKADDAEAPRSGVPSIVGWVASVGAIILGLVLLIFPLPFVQALVYILAAVVIIGGVYQFYMIGRGYQPLNFPVWFYALPVLIILAGAYVLFTTGDGQSRAVELIILGSGFVVYALTSVLEMAAAATFARKQRKSGAVVNTPPTE